MKTTFVVTLNGKEEWSSVEFRNFLNLYLSDSGYELTVDKRSVSIQHGRRIDVV